MNPPPTTVAIYMFGILKLGIHPDTLIYRLLPSVGVCFALWAPPSLCVSMSFASGVGECCRCQFLSSPRWSLVVLDLSAALPGHYKRVLANRQADSMLSDMPAHWRTPSSAQLHNYHLKHLCLIKTPLSQLFLPWNYIQTTVKIAML